MERIFITPLAKRLAHINKIDPNSLTGSGPRGRIIKSDVEKIIKNKDLNIAEQSSKQTSLKDRDWKVLFSMMAMMCYTMIQVKVLTLIHALTLT